MKMKIDIVDNFIDVWSEEKGIWERYVKIELEKEHKIPEKLDPEKVSIYKMCLKINEIIDYLEVNND